MNLAQVIKLVRERQSMNMVEFGAALGVTHAQVSRYEAGRAMPGYLPLARLLQLAEGAEKNPILERMGAVLGTPAGELSEAEAIAAVERLGPGYQLSRKADQKQDADKAWREVRIFAPNLVQLMRIVNALFLERREVDASLVRIVHSWFDRIDDSDPVVRQCFSEADQYLEYLLKTKTSGGIRAPLHHQGMLPEEPAEAENGKAVTRAGPRKRA